MPLHFQAVLPAAPLGLELACGYVADVLAFQAANGGPFSRSCELEYATRRLARTARELNLPYRALVTWLTVADAAAFGGTGRTADVVRQMNAWVGEEFSVRAA